MIKTKIIERPINEKCPYCESGKPPLYKDYKDLADYLTGRAKIMPKTRTGFCSKHQREFTKAVKRARFLALLPYVETVS